MGLLPTADCRPLVTDYTPELAAMLIYLNRTGFNGLFRLNRKGGFNVPAGRYTNPTICDAEHVRAVARALSARGVTLECSSFEDALADAGVDDFVYCDPPYAPLSRTSNFAHYTAGGFTTHDHARLQAHVIAAAGRGATVLVSNSSTPEIRRAYRTPAARNAGLVVEPVAARRAINSRASARGPVDELIISNSPAGPRSDALDAPRGTRPTSKLRMAKAGLRARYPYQLAAAGARKGQSKI
jgi:DNA adenine methylase